MNAYTLKIWLKKILHLFVVAIFLIQNNFSYAEPEVKTIHLNPNFGFPLKLSENAATIAIGDPNLIDIVTIEPNMLMITGQLVGATSLTVFGKSGAIYQYRVQVTSDISQLRHMIQSLEPRVSVEDINGKVLLTGEVDTPAALTRVLTIADRFVGGAGQPDFKVVSDYGGVLAGNLDESEEQVLTGFSLSSGGGRNRGGAGQSRGSATALLDPKANLAQNVSRASAVSIAGGRILSLIKVINQPKVEIQMRVVEVDRTKTDQFGIDWRLDGNNVSVGSFAGGVTSTLPAPSDSAPLSSGSANLVGFFQPGKYFLSTFLRMIEEKGATSTLSEPLLTAISGESARFMVGGQVPIPVQATTSSTNSVAVATNVRFESFGLSITVRPTVLENGKISIILDQSMSELDYANGIQIIGARVPGFKQKSVSTITESESGETWAVAGLLTEEDRKSLKSVPWISKVPILGKLFENKDDSTSRNELFILVNARRIDTPNTTTTNFDGKGKLEPRSSKNEVSTDPVYQDKQSQELNSNGLILTPPKQGAPQVEQLKEESKSIPLNIEKQNDGKSKTSPLNAKGKKIALSDSKVSKGTQGNEQDEVRIVRLKEKDLPTEKMVNESKVERLTANNELDDLQIFSFNPEKIIREVVTSQPSEPLKKSDVTNNETTQLKSSLTKQKAPTVVSSQAPSTNKESTKPSIQEVTQNKPAAPNDLPTVASAIDQVKSTSTQQDIKKNEPAASDSKPFKEDVLSLLGDVVRVKVVVVNFLAGKDKIDYFKDSLKKGTVNTPPQTEWSKWKIAIGAIDGNVNHLVKFAVPPEMRRDLYSGASAYIDLPKKQYQYAIDYQVQ